MFWNLIPNRFSKYFPILMCETIYHKSNSLPNIKKLPQVVECHLMAGDGDFLLGVVAADLDDYRRNI